MGGVISQARKRMGRVFKPRHVSRGNDVEKAKKSLIYSSGNTGTDSDLSWYTTWDTADSSEHSDQSRQKKDVPAIDRRAKETSVSLLEQKTKKTEEGKRRVFQEISKLPPEEQHNFAVSAVDSLRNRLNNGLWKADNASIHSDQSGQIDKKSKEPSVSDVANVSKRRDSLKREIFVTHHDGIQESGGLGFSRKMPQLRARSKVLEDDSSPDDIYKAYEAFLAENEGVDMSSKWSTNDLSTEELQGPGVEDNAYSSGNTGTDSDLSWYTAWDTADNSEHSDQSRQKKDVPAIDRRAKETSVSGFTQKMKERKKERRHETDSLGRRTNGNPEVGRI